MGLAETCNEVLRILARQGRLDTAPLVGDVNGRVDNVYNRNLWRLERYHPRVVGRSGCGSVGLGRERRGVLVLAAEEGD